LCLSLNYSKFPLDSHQDFRNRNGMGKPFRYPSCHMSGCCDAIGSLLHLSGLAHAGILSFIVMIGRFVCRNSLHASCWRSHNPVKLSEFFRIPSHTRPRLVTSRKCHSLHFRISQFIHTSTGTRNLTCRSTLTSRMSLTCRMTVPFQYWYIYQNAIMARIGLFNKLFRFRHHTSVSKSAIDTRLSDRIWFRIRAHNIYGSRFDLIEHPIPANLLNVWSEHFFNVLTGNDLFNRKIFFLEDV
jgi:hypothetical protein